MDIFCYSSGLAGRDPLSGNGPMQLVQHSPILHPEHCINLETQTDHHGVGQNALTETHRLCQQLAKLTHQSVMQNRYFMTLSGDHSSAIGTWSGAYSACHQQHKTPGLIWIDAHMDSHTPESSPTQNIHGMPLASLLGYGYDDLRSILSATPKLQPQNVILIGIRSFEPPEKEFLDSLNVTIYYAEDVLKRGYHTVLQEALTRLDPQIDALGVTIDIDAIDPTQAPGVSTPEPGGLAAQDVIDALPLIQQHPKLIGCEISEFLPAKDENNKTLNITLNIIEGLAKNKNGTKPFADTQLSST